MILQGDRHAQPANCSDGLYATLLACWNKDPTLRPSFKDLATTLHGFSAPQVSPRQPAHESELGSLARRLEDDQQAVDVDGYLTPNPSRRSSLGGSKGGVQAGPIIYDTNPASDGDGGGEDAVGRAMSEYADFNMEANAPAPSTIARARFVTPPFPRVAGGQSGGAGDGSTTQGSITFI